MALFSQVPPREAYIGAQVLPGEKIWSRKKNKVGPRCIEKAAATGTSTFCRDWTKKNRTQKILVVPLYPFLKKNTSFGWAPIIALLPSKCRYSGFSRPNPGLTVGSSASGALALIGSDILFDPANEL